MRPRHLQPELMDDPALPAAEHVRALGGLARINRLSRAAATLWPPIRDALSVATDHAPTLLDVATGSGDLPIAIALRARRAGLRVQISACDLSPLALRVASERAARAKVDIAFEQRDALAEGFGRADASVDIVTCSLFLHHLNPAQAIHALSQMRRVARHRVIVSDLRRCQPGLLAAHVAGRLLNRSPVVRVDAVRSVRAAFTEPELRSLAESAGMPEARIVRRWPFRMLLTWSRR